MGAAAKKVPQRLVCKILARGSAALIHLQLTQEALTQVQEHSP